MATLSIDIPDALVSDLLAAIAPRMVDAPQPVIAAIAAKVVAGQTTTNAEKKALAEAWIKRNAKAALLDYRGQVAAIRAREDPNDAAVSW